MLTWAIRQFVNLSLAKNATDVALAVDAMELACETRLVVTPKRVLLRSMPLLQVLEQP